MTLSCNLLYKFIGMPFFSRLLLASFTLITCAVFNTSDAQVDYEGGFPYNPDSDNNGTIEVNDLLVFLPFYGANFNADGVIPIAYGGTGATSALAARDSLGLTSIQDSLYSGATYAWINGSARIMSRFAQGFAVSATGLYAHASGTNVTASGAYSNAQNRLTVASATCSSAEGEGTTASGTASHAEGMLSTATSLTSHAEGYNTAATANYSHAEGYGTSAESTAAHAQGYLTTASGLYAHAEGRQNEASGNSAHAEGQASAASGDVAHAEGFGCIASGYASHAGGFESTASGLYSRAVGRSTLASASNAFASGFGVVADQENGAVFGQFNASGQENLLLVVGNGSDNANRSDAFTVSNQGDATIHGNASILGDLNVNGIEVAAVLTELLGAVDSLQSTITQLQAQIEILNDGE